ncbi:MAG: type I methionyl aminopeptidase [Campylobacter sp.]|nr:type I methionyl aminopeptidase [Campylobacter sp.]
MAISFKNSKDLKGLRAANKIVAAALDYAEEFLKPGMTLLEVDAKIDKFITDQGAYPAFKGLYDFPNAACLSLNEVCIHGIPDQTVLKEGDILGVDIGSRLNGYYGDSARTYPIGEISKSDYELIKVSKDALCFAIENIKVGMYFKELSSMIEEFIKSKGYVPLFGYCGHGIGKRPHEEPEIPNYLVGKAKQGPKIKNGMVFCIEPMICQKDAMPVVASDGWAVRSKDGLNTSHYEHCIAVTNNKVEILSKI